ncbi:MAG: DASS family sodium-coupled anion symporter [Planctomycetota bacterium]
MPADVVTVERQLSFDAWRRRIGLLLAPTLFTVLLVADLPSLGKEAHRLAAVIAAVVILWISEALPMPLTALLGASACVVLRVAPAKEVFAPFANPLMFLFIGSFMLARALFVHQLDRRFAFAVLSIRWVGARPSRILFAFGGATAFISAWISNTATTAMMFAIGMSILKLIMRDHEGGGRIDRRYATGLMLMTSFAASIGGLATPIGTPPNIIGLSFIRERLGVDFSFFRWSTIGAPVVIVLYLFLFFYLDRLCPARVREIPGSHEMIVRERASLGRLTRAQKSTLVACVVTVALWIVPGIVALGAGESSATYKSLNASVPEGVAALLGAALLFLLPGERGARAMKWEDAIQIDWGIVLLYGGGFALGELAAQTRLAEATGQALTQCLPLHGEIGLLAASTIVAVLLSETTSNTAAANIIVPVVIEIARSAGVDPLAPALGATFGASLGFMLPVSTPCNAIVYGSGYVPLRSMIRYGVLLDIVGAAAIIALVRLITPALR